jgi:hypothetical protein
LFLTTALAAFRMMEVEVPVELHHEGGHCLLPRPASHSRTGRHPHHAEVLMHGGQLGDEPVLRHVRVLILVHVHVAEAPGVALADDVVFREELHRLADQVVEVERIAAAQLLLVTGVDLRQVLVVECLAGRAHVLRRHQPVLERGDLRQHAAGAVLVVGQLQFGQHALDQRLLVVRVVNGETVLEPARRALPAQDADAGGVKRAHPHAGHGAAQQLRDARAHFGRGLVREREGQDIARGDAPGLHEVGDAVRQHAACRAVIHGAFRPARWGGFQLCGSRLVPRPLPIM